MKRKHHEIAGSSDQQPNVKRIRKLLPYLSGELVRRISEFVVELTHTRFIGMFPMLSPINPIRNPGVYDIQLTNQTPFVHLPLPYRNHRTLRFTRIEIANGQRWVLFRTLQAVGYYFIWIPLDFIQSLTRNVSGLVLTAIPNLPNPNQN